MRKVNVVCTMLIFGFIVVRVSDVLLPRDNKSDVRLCVLGRMILNTLAAKHFDWLKKKCVHIFERIIFV